ncbi:hypothetical protein ACLOJK_038936 [Asimina triloba]
MRMKLQFNTLHVYNCRCTAGAPKSGAPSSPSGCRPTHFRRGSDQSIGAVQKIRHEKMINRIQRHPTTEPITMVASTSPSSTEQLALQQFVQHAPSASARSDAI